MTKQHDNLILLELNELNFDLIAKYVAAGELKNFKKLINDNRLISTTSEDIYEEIEPWIQWVTVHTGLTYGQHKVFRLGDIDTLDAPQIFEQVEQHGLSVGAISPMNTANRLKAPEFFVPDPWTKQDVVGGKRLKKLYAIIHKLVNNNAASKQSYSLGDVATLGAAFLFDMEFKYKKEFLKLAIASRKGKWRRAIALDVLLFAIFKKYTIRKDVDFSTLFLNCAAHIQHHYFYNNAFYEGDATNPDWYVSKDKDPLLEVYKAYDIFIGDLLQFTDHRFMLLTGLKQKPYEDNVFYWRLSNHADFLTRLGIEFANVQPRMSRDFLVDFENEQQAEKAETVFGQAKVNGLPIFETSNRGNSLFVTLTYPADISKDSVLSMDAEEIRIASEDFSFVAIKNGHHDGEGYLLSNSKVAQKLAATIPLADVNGVIKSHFGMEPESRPG